MTIPHTHPTPIGPGRVFGSPVSLMPRPVKDIRELMTLASRKDIQSAVVKKNPKSVTKFKLRGSRYQYTLAVGDADRAQKIIQSLPPTLEVTTIEKKAPKKTSY